MTTSYNGWPASPVATDIHVVPFAVKGVSFPAGVKDGDVEVVFNYLFTQLDLRVEKIHKGWCWGWYFRPNRNDPSTLSCHASATAGDYNAPAHPNGVKGTWSAKQIAEIRKITEVELEGVVRCGEFFHGTTDGMHFEINAGKDKVAKVADKIRAGRVGKINPVKKVIKKVVTPRPKPKATDGVISLGFTRYGKENADVRELQRVLNAWFPPLHIKVDGIYGRQTVYGVNFARKRFGMAPRSAHAGLEARLLRKLGFRVTP